MTGRTRWVRRGIGPPARSASRDTFAAVRLAPRRSGAPGRHYARLVKLVKLVFLGDLVGEQPATVAEIRKAGRARPSCPASAWSLIPGGASTLPRRRPDSGVR